MKSNSPTTKKRNIKKLNLYFYTVASIVTKEKASDYWIGENPKEIFDYVVEETKGNGALGQLNVSVKGTIPLPTLLKDLKEEIPECFETKVVMKEDPKEKVKRLNKKRFKDSLQYTLDYVIIDDKDKKALKRIINKI